MGSLTTFFGFGLLILQFGGNPILAIECKDGFLSIGGVQGCFKLLKTDGRQNWFTAKNKCEGLGLRLVKPKSDACAITLREYLLTTLGPGSFWLGAMGDGTNYVWEHDQTTLANNADLINKQYSQGECLTLSVNTDSFNNYPNRPYGIGECSSTKYAIICEDSSTANELSTQTNGCPDGYEEFVGVEGCFKWSSNPPRTWLEAKAYCGLLNSDMAYPRPVQSDAVTLRRRILNTHGHSTFWLGARAGSLADHSKYRWQHDGTVLSSNNLLWFPGLPKDEYNKYCLTLLADQISKNKHSGKPYGKDDCTTLHSTLCKVNK